MCFFFKQKTAYERRISDWSSDVCSSDLCPYHFAFANSKSQDVAAMTAGTKKLVELGTIDDVEKVATRIYNSGVSQIVKEAMEKQFPAAGFDIVANEIFEPTATDITVQLEKKSEEHTSELQSLMRISYAV